MGRKGLEYEIISDIESQIDKLFNNDETVEKNEERQNIIDVKNNFAKIRVATLVYCRDVDVRPRVEKNMRLGVVADRGLKLVAERFGERIRPASRVMEKELKIGNWRVVIYGKADLVYKEPFEGGMWIPIEFKSSKNQGTIEKGREQTAIYAWLYDAPYGILIYGSDFRFEIIKAVDEEALKKKVEKILRLLLAGIKEMDVLCPTIVPKVLYKSYLTEHKKNGAKKLEFFTEHPKRNRLA